MRTLVIALSAMLLASVEATAQDKPYSAKVASYSSLLKPASYRESPLQLQYTLVEARQVVRGPRLDFEHVYNVPYEQFVEEMTRAYTDQIAVSALRPGAIPYLQTSELFVFGMNETRDRGLRFTLGLKDVAMRFSFDVTPDQNRTVVTIHNAVFSELYSGVMPARAGYKPKDAESVSFRWN